MNIFDKKNVNFDSDSWTAVTKCVLIKRFYCIKMFDMEKDEENE